MSVVHSPPEGTAQPSGEADLGDTPISSTKVGECTTPSLFMDTLSWEKKCRCCYGGSVPEVRRVLRHSMVEVTKI